MLKRISVIFSIITILSKVMVAHAQQGMLEANPRFGPDTFRVYQYTDTVFNNYQSYPDIKDFIKDRFPISYSFNACQFIGIANYFHNIDRIKGSTKRMKAGRFQLNNSKGEALALFGSFHASFEDDSLSYLSISNGDFGSLSFKNSHITNLAIGLDTLRSLHIYDSLTRINRLTIVHSFINEIAINYLADTLVLIDIRADPPLNFKGAIGSSIRNRIHHLRILSKDVDKIDFEYHYFKLYFRGDDSYDDKIGVYTALLESFKRKGYSSSFEKLDKEFQEFKHKESGRFGYFLNWIDQNWWGYGYNKFLVVRNAAILNLLFFLINIFLFDNLINHGYNLQKFVRVNSSINKKFSTNRFKRTLAKSPYVFLYTCYIFWGLRLDINNLGIHKVRLFMYVLFQYIVGIICLAYFANLIITI